MRKYYARAIFNRKTGPVGEYFDVNDIRAEVELDAEHLTEAAEQADTLLPADFFEIKEMHIYYKEVAGEADRPDQPSPIVASKI